MAMYELTIVTAGKATAAKKKTLSKKIEEIVKTNKGKVVKVDDWGVIELAYEIKGNKSGSFLQFGLDLKESLATTVSNKVRLDKDVIRNLMVRKD